MGNKIFGMAILWGAIIITYIFIAFFFPAHGQLVQETLTSFNATADMSNFPGTYEAVESSYIWIWVIPGLVGIVVSTVMLLRK